MDTIVNGCVIENEVLMFEEYGEEVLYAGWNPQLVLASESSVARRDKPVYPPADLRDMDVDTFLKRMYEYQC